MAQNTGTEAEPLPVTIVTAQGHTYRGRLMHRLPSQICAIVDGRLPVQEAVEVQLPDRSLLGGVLYCTEQTAGAFVVGIELIMWLETAAG